MKILFDLRACQPIGNTKFHGGGKYGLVVLKRLLELAPQKISVHYDKGAYLDEAMSAMLQSCGVTEYYASDMSLYDAARKESKIVYSPLFARNDIPDDITVIHTQHGLRVLEMPSDSTQKYYAVDGDNLWRKTRRTVKGFVFGRYQQHIENQYRQRLLHKNMDIVTVSNHSKYSLQCFFPELSGREIEVFYSPSTIDDSVSIDGYSNPYGKYYLVVSANRWVKNGYRTLKGLDELFSEHPELDGKVVVTGLSSWSQMKMDIKNKDRFVLLGYVDEPTLKALYHHAYLLVYGSLNEGFGYPPLEAMHEGCPVAASAIASIPEVCGDAALYFNPFLKSEMKMRILQMENAAERDMYIQRGLERQRLVADRQKADLDKLCHYILQRV